MNTPTHLLLGLACFGKARAPARNIAALAGGLAPDLSLYLMAGWGLFVLGRAPHQVFGSDYFSESWQAVFAVDNSFVIWGVFWGATIAIARRGSTLTWLPAFAGAGFLHLCFDYPFHRDDARVQFWPLSDHVFRSPVSYWDPAHFGGVVAWFEIALVGLMFRVLWRRHRSAGLRISIALTAVAILVPGVVFSLLMVRGGGAHP